jgi:RNA:NAD 2'-phosphotransferase (TPT1/KptA family)
MLSFSHFLAEADDDVELYHGTSQQRANTIAKEGFRLRAVRQQTMGGDPESSRNYIWFAKRFESARSYAELHKNPVVITIQLSAALLKQMDPYGRNSGPDSVWLSPELSAQYITDVTKV